MVDQRCSTETWWFGIDRKWWTLFVVAVGTFMSALDGSVVNTALPVIGRELRSPLPTLEWVILIYLLTVISTLLVFGRLSDMYGRKAFYIVGLSVFVLGSVLSGMSPSVRTLIGFRALQALGAAVLYALGPAVLTASFPGHERGRALGMQATVTYLGLATGPALGGFLTQHLGWRSIFYINLPIGMMVLPLAIKALRHERTGHPKPFDIPGAALLAVALASLMYALSKGEDMGWSSASILVLFGVGVAALISFIVTERVREDPMLDLRLFSNWTFAASTLAAFLNYVCTSAVSFLMPFYLINASGYRVDMAGLILIATPAVMSVTALPSGWLSDRVGQRLPSTIGMSITVTGLLLLRTLWVGTSAVMVMLVLALIGLGVGLFTSPNNSAIMGSAPAERRGVAGALLAAARNMGFAIGVAVSGSIYTARLAHLHHAMSEAQSITRSMHDATTVIAFMGAVGILASALRGRTVAGGHG